jgi:4Fe-4S ferredoxin
MKKSSMPITYKKNRITEFHLRRTMLNRDDWIVLNRSLCNGCGLCSEVCPKEAITVKPATLKDGRLLYPPKIEIEESLCIFCGICAIICPLNAMTTWVNGEKNAMFVENDAFPELLKRIDITQEKCQPDCAIQCVDSCPREAIHVDLERQCGKVTKILDVQIDISCCMYCKACEYVCPYDAIEVEKPFEGLVQLESQKCPDDCHLCIDICPSDALKTLENGEIKVDARLCVVCKACQTICPEGAMTVAFKQVLHSPIQSSTWIHLLQRFASSNLAAKELASKATEKRKSRIQTLPLLEE